MKALGKLSEWSVISELFSLKLSLLVAWHSELMRVLIFTSSGGTAHDAAAYAIEPWLKRWDPDGEVLVEHVLENASVFTRAGVALYNWIQRHGPWMHQIYWRVVEFEDVTKPGTLLAEESSRI